MAPLQILLLEDVDDDAELIEKTIARAGIAAAVRHVRSEFTFLNALHEQRFDLVLVDFSLPRFDGISAPPGCATRTFPLFSSPASLVKTLPLKRIPLACPTSC